MKFTPTARLQYELSEGDSPPASCHPSQPEILQILGLNLDLWKPLRYYVGYDSCLIAPCLNQRYRIKNV